MASLYVANTRALAPQAFRTQAKVQHPDKGGDADQFGRLQRSFEILSDPKKRAVYDTWAKELQFRYVRGVAAKARLHCATPWNRFSGAFKAQGLV